MQLNRIIERYGKKPDSLIQILLEYQSTKSDNCITEEEVSRVAGSLGISKSRVYSIVTFYSLFSTVPRGKYVIQVCDDVPCYVNDSVNVIEELERILKISMGQTTPDGVFSLEKTSCIGCCDMAPAMRIGDELYGDLTDKKIFEIISLYRRKFNENRE